MLNLKVKTFLTHFCNINTENIFSPIISYKDHTHHVFLVLLEVGVDKKAPGGVGKRVLNIVYTLIPARGQRGGSSGDLMGVQRLEIHKDVSTFRKKNKTFN